MDLHVGTSEMILDQQGNPSTIIHTEQEGDTPS